jgi:exodeoxyribonuclease-5
VTIAPARLDVGRALDAVEQIAEEFGQPRLTATQRKFVLDVLNPLVTNELKGFITLEGAAGCGKTVTLVTLILAAYQLDLSVAIVAPTHKAASVLRRKLDKFIKRFPGLPEPGTLHSLLRLKPAKVAPGQPETFKQTGNLNLSAFDLILVDECSMVGKELLKYIVEAARAYSLPVVFSGDPHQLQPVNERGKSQTFNVKVKYELNEILRHDGAILNLATRIRTLRFIPQIGPDKSGGSSVHTYRTISELQTQWIQTLKTANDAGHADDVAMLCWTNANRRMFNDTARKALYGDDVPRFMEEDSVVTLSPLERDNKIWYANNEDMTIKTAVHESSIKPVEALDLTFSGWALTLTDGNTIFVLDDSELPRFKTITRNLVNSIKTEVTKHTKVLEELKLDKPEDYSTINRARAAVEAARRRWATEYFPLNGFFANVDFRYAQTIHKSQGSQYGDVFINDDYLRSSSEDVQLLYVAVTRAETTVHHLHTKRE